MGKDVHRALAGKSGTGSRWYPSPKERARHSTGRVISPLLANLFLHYVLDKWLTKQCPGIAFVRYADDIVVHCHTEEEAKQLLAAIKARLADCKLRLSEEKTKMVYCKDYRRKQKNDYEKKFDFLGFTFKPKTLASKKGGLFLAYDCAISQKAQTRIIAGWKQLKWHRKSQLPIQEIANQVNQQMRSIIRYYGKFKLWTLERLMLRFEGMLVKWVLKKYNRFNGSNSKAQEWIKRLKRDYPTMFYYWTVIKHV